MSSHVQYDGLPGDTEQMLAVHRRRKEINFIRITGSKQRRNVGEGEEGREGNVQYQGVEAV